MKKIEKPDWEDMEKTGFVLNGFVKIDNWTFRELINKSDMQCASLYMMLLSHRNTKTNQCFPTIKTLSEECGVSSRTIKNMLNTLYEIGAIIINTGKQGVANNYYFPVEDFYEDFAKDINQNMAKRRTKAFQKLNKS